MNLKLSDYLQMMWRRKWIIVFAAVITVGVAAFRTQNLKRVYTASTTLRILTASIGSSDFVQYDLTYTDRLMNTYAKIAESRPLLQQLSDQLSLNGLPSVSVNVIPQTELMQISVDNPDPQQAQKIANALAALLIQNIESNADGNSPSTSETLNAQLQEMQTELDKARSDYQALAATLPVSDQRIAALEDSIRLKEQIYGTLLDQYQKARALESIKTNSLSVIEAATVPTAPSSPNVPLNIGLGAVVGLILGLALAFSLENLDTTLYSSRQIEALLDLKTLGRIPTFRQKKGSLINANSPQAEAYRTLRTNLLNLSRENPVRTLVITSAEPGEGKSTTAAHLALALGQANVKVVLVDCDLRRPKQHRIFACPNEVGLTDWLQSRAQTRQVIQEDAYPGVALITSGTLGEDGHPAELLGSDNMRRLLTQLSVMYDMVVLDVPAARVVVDGAIVASMADGVLFVVGRTLVKTEEVREAYQQLSNVNARIIGITVNRAENNHKYSYYARNPVRAVAGQQ